MGFPNIVPEWGIEFEIIKSEVVKSAEDDDAGGGTRILEGLATTGDFDIQGDIVSSEAIIASKDDLLKRSTLLLNHREDQPIGKVLETEVRKEGLWIKAMVSKTADRIWDLIQEGVLSKFSIRGKIIQAKEEWVPSLKRMARVIKRMVILEASVVSVPANEGARTLNSYIQKQQVLELAIQELQGKLGGLDMTTDKNDALEDLFTDPPDESTGNPPGDALNKGGEEPPDPSGAEDQTQTDPPNPGDQTDGLNEELLAKAESELVVSQIQALVTQLLDQNKDASQVSKLNEIKSLAGRLKDCEPGEDYPYPKRKPGKEGDPAAGEGEPKSADLKELEALRAENQEMKSLVKELTSLLTPKEEKKDE